MNHEKWMQLALEQAHQAAQRGEVPVGAVLVQGERVLAAAGNERERRQDPTAHAEMLVLRAAAKVLGKRRLTGCTLYVTLEPCPMCAGAIALAAPDAVIFGASDAKAGCCGSVYRITEDPALALAKVPAYSGFLAQACAQVLEDFFAARRKTP